MGMSRVPCRLGMMQTTPPLICGRQQCNDAMIKCTHGRVLLLLCMHACSSSTLHAVPPMPALGAPRVAFASPLDSFPREAPCLCRSPRAPTSLDLKSGIGLPRHEGWTAVRDSHSGIQSRWLRNLGIPCIGPGRVTRFHCRSVAWRPVVYKASFSSDFSTNCTVDCGAMSAICVAGGLQPYTWCTCVCLQPYTWQEPHPQCQQCQVSLL